MITYYPQDEDELRKHTFNVKTHDGKIVELVFEEKSTFVKEISSNVHFKKIVPDVEGVMERIMSVGISVENGRHGVVEVEYKGSKSIGVIKPVDEEVFFDRIFKKHKTVYVPVRISKTTVI